MLGGGEQPYILPCSLGETHAALDLELRTVLGGQHH